MPGHVESDDAELGKNLRVVLNAAILAAVGSCGVKADEWNALPKL